MLQLCNHYNVHLFHNLYMTMTFPADRSSIICGFLLLFFVLFFFFGQEFVRGILLYIQINRKSLLNIVPLLLPLPLFFRQNKQGGESISLHQSVEYLQSYDNYLLSFLSSHGWALDKSEPQMLGGGRICRVGKWDFNYIKKVLIFISNCGAQEYIYI